MSILRDPGGERLFLEGRLEGVSVPDLLHAICLPGKTGLLTVSHGELTKTVYVQQGQLIFASSNDPEERLGETLLRSGVIGYRQLEEAVAALGGGKRLGAILVGRGHLEPANLVRGLLYQVKEIILGLFPWTTGSYRFVEGPLPTAEVITLNIATAKLICDGIRRIDSWPRIVRAVGTSRTTYRLTRDGRLLAAELDLGEAEREILSLLEEPTPVGGICRGVFLPNFDVYQYLWAFRILGIARQVEEEPAARAADEALRGDQGTLAETPLPQLLLALAQETGTGVLHLSRDWEERTIHMKEGIVSFATSNRAEESLTSFLLRRGVIALRDKEEIEARMLSNKRAGTILRDLGILTQDELARFVREQLLEVVLAAFSWDRGTWRFTRGALPTLEEICLDRPVAELVLQGIRAVRDWSRIREGCGGLGTILAPVPRGQARLAGVELGVDEKDLLAAISGPRTVGEICAATQLSDFRTAQILWSLRVLGVLERLESMPQSKAPAPPDLRAEQEAAPVVGAGGAAGRAEERGRPQVLPDAAEDASAWFAGSEGKAAGKDETISIPVVVSAGGDGSADPPAGEPMLTTAAVGENRDSTADAGSAVCEVADVTPAAGTPGLSPAAGEAISIAIAVTEPRSAAETAALGTPAPSADAVDQASLQTGEPASVATAAEEAGGPTEAPVSVLVAAEEPSNLAGGRTSVAVAAEEAGGSTEAPGSVAVSVEAGGFAEAPIGVAIVAEEAGGRIGEPVMVVPPGDAGTVPGGEGAFLSPAAEGEPGLPEQVSAGAGPEVATVEGESGIAAIVGQASSSPNLPGESGELMSPAPAPAPRTPLEAVGTGVLEEIERFNRRHREVFAVLKGSVGAGARNLVANCARRLGEGAQIFAGLAMDQMGAFPAEILFERFGALAPSEIQVKLEALIAAEIAFCDGMLDGPTVARLQTRLEQAGAGQVGTAPR